MYLLAVGVGLNDLGRGGRSDNSHTFARDSAVGGSDRGRASHQIGSGITSLLMVRSGAQISQFLSQETTGVSNIFHFARTRIES